MTESLQYRNSTDGFTILEVVVAIFIFGCITSAIFNLIHQTDKLHGKTMFVELASRIAADEAERLRNIAFQNNTFEDSSYTMSISGRVFEVSRKIMFQDANTGKKPAFEPVEIEITVGDNKNPNMKPLTFKLLMGNDSP